MAAAATTTTTEVSTTIVLHVSLPRGDIYSPRTVSELLATAVLESGADQSGIITVVTPRKDYTYHIAPSKFARPVQETCKFASAELVK